MSSNKNNISIGSVNLKSWRYILISILGVITIYSSFVTVGAGQRGTLLRFGAVQEGVLGEGLHLKIPFIERIIEMDVKIQKSHTVSVASTKDLQDTKFENVVNFHILPEKVNRIYQRIGIDYKSKIIDPAVQEVVKAVSAKYTAEELIVQRDEVSKGVRAALIKKLENYDILVDNFSIVNFQFSEQFTQAIEEKQTAEQKALKAQRDLERIKFEAKQKIEEARAEAEALRLKGRTVTNQLIELKRIEAKLKAIEKWNGQLPNVTTNTVPFLNLQEK